MTDFLLIALRHCIICIATTQYLCCSQFFSQQIDLLAKSTESDCSTFIASGCVGIFFIKMLHKFKYFHSAWKYFNVPLCISNPDTYLIIILELLILILKLSCGQKKSQSCWTGIKWDFAFQFNGSRVKLSLFFIFYCYCLFFFF